MTVGAQCDTCGQFLAAAEPSDWQSRPWRLQVETVNGTRNFCGARCLSEWAEKVRKRQDMGHGSLPDQNDFPAYPSHLGPRGYTRDRVL